jgi:probable rRNA maturation factor
MSRIKIQVADLQKRYKADPRRVRALARSVLAAEGRAGRRLSVALVNDREIARIHVDFLGVPGPTDVVSFPLEDEHDDLLGEVVVSTDTAAREAKKRRLTLEREVLLYVVHGILHLCGYDDQRKKDREVMHARQEELLEAFLARRALSA